MVRKNEAIVNREERLSSPALSLKKSWYRPNTKATCDPMGMNSWLLVMAGGAVGSLARYLLVTFVQSRNSGVFPLGTFVVNLTGSFLIGAVMTLISERWMDNIHLRLLLAVGLLGGFTTFSSLEYEAFAAYQKGYRAAAVGYVLGSIVAGYAAVFLGWLVTSRR